MSFLGYVVFFVLLIVAGFMLFNGVIVCLALAKGKFRTNQFLKSFFAALLFIILFQVAINYHEDLAIPKTCAQNALSC